MLAQVQDSGFLSGGPSWTHDGCSLPHLPDAYGRKIAPFDSIELFMANKSYMKPYCGKLLIKKITNFLLISSKFSDRYRHVNAK